MATDPFVLRLAITATPRSYWNDALYGKNMFVRQFAADRIRRAYREYSELLKKDHN